jgi:hypothetical protein
MGRTNNQNQRENRKNEKSKISQSHEDIRHSNTMKWC